MRRCTAFYQDVEMPKWKPVGCQCRHRSIHAVLGCNLDRNRLHLFRTSVRSELLPPWHLGSMRIPPVTVPRTPGSPPTLRWTLLAMGAVRSSPDPDPDPDATCR